MTNREAHRAKRRKINLIGARIRGLKASYAHCQCAVMNRQYARFFLFPSDYEQELFRLRIASKLARRA